MMSKEERERAECAAVEHYADIDDDEDSPLGAAIFREVTGRTIDEVIDAEDDEQLDKICKQLLDKGADARSEKNMAKSVVINHLNYPDKRGRVYCRAKNAITEIVTGDCLNCPLYYGSMQGAGVECMYSDFVTDDISVMALTVPDPAAQFALIAKLIEKGLIAADPLHKEEKM